MKKRSSPLYVRCTPLPLKVLARQEKRRFYRRLVKMTVKVFVVSMTMSILVVASIMLFAFGVNDFVLLLTTKG